MRSITHPLGPVASPGIASRITSLPPEQDSNQIRGFHDDLRRTVLSTQSSLEEQEPNTLLIEDSTLYHGFVQLPKLVLYARNLSRDAKLLYAVLLGYAWQEQRCFPGYKRLCDDLDASENMVRKYMRELEAVHLLSQRRRGQGRTNIYLLHDLRTSKIEVQDQHKIAVLEPQKSEDNEETVKKQTEQKESGVRTSKGSYKSQEETRNERLFTHAPVVSTTKDRGLRSFAEQQTRAFTPLQQNSTPSRSHEANGMAKGRGEKEAAQAHQLGGMRKKIPDWLPGYIVDFSQEFHDEVATPSNITRAAHLFERAQIDTDTFIEQLYEARKITKGRANIQKRSDVGKKSAWPAGFPNRMPYFFRVLEDLLCLRGREHSNAGGEPAEEGLATASKVEGACMEERAEANNDAPPLMKAGPAEEAAAKNEESGSSQEELLAAADTDMPTVTEPAFPFPEEVELAKAATVATWKDRLPDPKGGQPRAVSMLWGFVRDAIRNHQNIARRSQLDALIPKWDATRPRTLLLLSETTYGACTAELNLRREIEQQIDKLLSHFF